MMTDDKRRQSKRWVGVLSDLSDWGFRTSVVYWEKHVSICTVLVSPIGFQWNGSSTIETREKKIFVYRHRWSFYLWRGRWGGWTYHSHPLGLWFSWGPPSEIRLKYYSASPEVNYLRWQKKKKEMSACQYSVNTWSWKDLFRRSPSWIVTCLNSEWWSAYIRGLTAELASEEKSVKILEMCGKYQHLQKAILLH